MPQGQWYTPDDIGTVWPDAPEAGELLTLVVESALEEVIFYLLQQSEWETDKPILARYRMAQLMHTQNTWNASSTSPDGGLGEGEFVLRPVPLDWAVKQKLNPKSNVPVIG